MMSLVSALETLHNANLCAGKELYSWAFYAIDDEPTSNLGDKPFSCARLDDCSSPTDVVIVGCTTVSELKNRGLNIWLSRHARGDIRVTGLMTGAFVLAESKILRESPVTLHWAYRDAFAEMYEDVALSTRPFLSDNSRCTSSGGITAIDLFLDFIEQSQGNQFASEVAESMNYITIRQAHHVASAEATARKRIKNARLNAVLKTMEENLEFPISPGEIASAAGISARQSERLFRRYLNQTPKQYYMQLRLKRAYFLLTQTEMSVVEAGLASGFNSPSHFSRCFRNEFGHSPSQILMGRET